MLPEFAAPVIAFLDESATDAKDSDFAVFGGIVMNRSQVPAFDRDWRAMLAEHRFAGPLHMKDISRTGDNPHVVGDACAVMLTEAVAVINEHRIFTFAASWDNRMHEQLFSDEMRRLFFSVYTLVFMMAVEINRATAERQGFQSIIDYVVDDGNRYKKHVQQTHTSIHTVPELSDFKVGGLSFGTDTNIPALQAADVVVWATRRRKAGKPLKGPHLPLNALFDDHFADAPAPEPLVRILAERFALREKGIDPGPLPD